MKLYVTIVEETPDSALRAIGAVTADHDGIEVRVENFHAYDPAAFRAATAKPIILTRRGTAQTPEETARAIAAGIDYVDVELGPDLDWIAPYRDRIVLSHHDYEGMSDVGKLIRHMNELGCAHTKLAVTPQTMRENLTLLECLENPAFQTEVRRARTEGLEGVPRSAGLTVIGMGERGLYSRILAPFLGSELMFVSPTEARSAAPGQISVDRALEIYGPQRASLRADKIFAIAGNPAGHSLSPSIHNPLFRSKGVAAAYTIASVQSFDEVGEALLGGKLAGLSVTAPFKEDAFVFARSSGATVGENARASGAVNTLVRTQCELVADNTDVDGFSRILARLCGRDRKTVALLGAGGTARAALVALQRAGMSVVIYNRTEVKARQLAAAFGAAHEPLEAASRFDGEIVINTLSAGADLPLLMKPGMTYIEAGYGHARHEIAAGVEHIDGLALLHAQGARQHELFMKVFE